VVDDRPLIDLWDGFEKSLNHLVKCFSLRYALAFGQSRIVNVEQDVIKIQAKAGNWLGVLSPETLNSLHITIHGFPKNEGYIVCSPIQKENKVYLNLMQGCNHDVLGDFQLVLLPIPQHLSSSIAILLGYPDRKDIALSSLMNMHPMNIYIKP